MEKITWKAKSFERLTLDEYFEILHLRTAIFVVEQNCPYQEVDEKDRKSIHLYGKTENSEIIAVARILPKGIAYKEISIGRFALKKTYRRKGLANELMREILKIIHVNFGQQPIRISAQNYLLSFYKNHGFKQIGNTYLEDNIPHFEMLRGKQKYVKN